METVADFVFLGSKITADCNYSHEMKTLAPCKKSYDKPRQYIKKQRHHFPDKGPSSHSYVFPVVTYGCESWTIKKAECWRIAASELWCWRRLLRVPSTARRSNQSINPTGNQPWIFSGRTDAEAEAPNTLATWCKELTHWRRPWCWERLKVREGDDRWWNGWMASPTQWTWVWVMDMTSRSCWWTGRPDILRFMESQRVGHDWVTEIN